MLLDGAYGAHWLGAVLVGAMFVSFGHYFPFVSFGAIMFGIVRSRLGGIGTVNSSYRTVFVSEGTLVVSLLDYIALFAIIAGAYWLWWVGIAVLIYSTGITCN